MTSFPSHMACNTVMTGYEYHFMDEQSVLQEYKCILCLSVAREPKQVTCCGKIVCTVCLERCVHNYRGERGPSGSSAPACPHCRAQHLTSFSDTKSYQKIISLRVRCTYKHNGCNWVGELKTFEEGHSHNCVYQVTECPDCKENVPKKHLKAHILADCKKRWTKCPHCPCENTYEFIYDTHKMTCKYWLVDCPSGCDKQMTQSEIEKHRETCLLQIVPCRYNENGCQVMVERKNLKDHEEECSMKVIALTQGQQQIKEQNEKSLTAPLMLRFEHFQRHKNDNEKWTSQPFYCYNGGYRVCLVVYPNGCGRSSNGSHLSCYIHLHHGHFDDHLPWPFRGTIKVSLRNQIEDGSHHEKRFKFCTGHPSGINKKPEKQSINDLGIGEPLFIRQDRLEKNDVKYLKNDKLVFHIDYEPLVTQKYNCHIVPGYRYSANIQFC